MEAAEKFLGATYKAKETGSFGDYGCISFNGNNVFETEMRESDCKGSTKIAT